MPSADVRRAPTVTAALNCAASCDAAKRWLRCLRPPDAAAETVSGMWQLAHEASAYALVACSETVLCMRSGRCPGACVGKSNSWHEAHAAGVANAASRRTA